MGKSSGGKARRHLYICPLSGPSHREATPACVLEPQALICSWICAHVCTYDWVRAHVHIYACVLAHACILSWVHIVYIVYFYTVCIGERACLCMCVCLYTYGLCLSSECLIPVCGCVFIQTDAVWWSECQHCSRLPITVCCLSCFSVRLFLSAEWLIC